MKSAVLIAAGVFALGSAVHAQEPPPSPPPAQQPAQPVAPAPAAAPAPPPPTLESRRDELRLMETALIQAVQKGAQDLARQLKLAEPGSAFVTGTGRARGFVLEGYGLFFDVDVPEMRQSVVWSMQMLELAQQRASAEQFLRNSAADDPRRAIAMAELRRVDRIMAAAQGQMSVPSPTQPMQLTAPLAAPPPGIAGAQNVAESTTSMSVAAPAPAPPVVTPSAPSANATTSPDALYTEAVKSALIDSMLRFGFALRIADSEWLAVAASDSTGPQVPGGFDESSRIVIRIKGADLAAYRAGKLTLEEVRKKVEVREF